MKKFLNLRMGRIYFIILSFIRSSKFFTQFIWGIKIDTKLHNTFWDLTTLVLKKELGQIKFKEISRYGLWSVRHPRAVL